MPGRRFSKQTRASSMIDLDLDPLNMFAESKHVQQKPKGSISAGMRHKGNLSRPNQRLSVSLSSPSDPKLIKTSWRLIDDHKQ
jgi:hypothetical protein